jgi:hypothetical protein
MAQLPRHCLRLDWSLWFRTCHPRSSGLWLRPSMAADRHAILSPGRRHLHSRRDLLRIPLPRVNQAWQVRYVGQLPQYFSCSRGDSNVCAFSGYMASFWIPLQIQQDVCMISEWISIQAYIVQ